MIRRTLAALVLVMSVASPAAACDPYWDDCWWWWDEPVYYEEPVYYVEEIAWWQEPVWQPAPAWQPEPAIVDVWWWQEPVWQPAPAWQPEPAIVDVWWWQEPAWAPPPASAPEPAWQPAPEPAPVIPQGLYLVTEVYVADIVSVAGPLTTYGTATAVETPGTYARVIDTVGTGTASAYDGAAFNGRTALDDGRSVAGTYYENFVLSNGEFVPVSVVFFQDDSALAAAAPPPPSASPAPTPATPVPIAVVQPAPFPAAATPMPVAAAPQAPPTLPVAIPTEVARIDPLVEPPLGSEPPRPQSGTAPRIPVIRPGISASPVGEVRSEIEVLRGRAIPLWVRATADSVPHPVASWRIRSGEHTALGPSSGGGDDAFSARWDVVTPPGVAWILGVDVTIVIGGVSQSSFGEIAVVVRSPALVR